MGSAIPALEKIACFSLVFAGQKLTTWSKKSLLVIFFTKLSTLKALIFALILNFESKRKLLSVLDIEHLLITLYSLFTKQF